MFRRFPTKEALLEAVFVEMQKSETPELVLHELTGGAYVEHAHAHAEGGEPFPASLSPTTLLP